MKYAHIYKARNKMFTLLVTTGASISEGILSEELYATKQEAKNAAKQSNATPWNY